VTLILDSGALVALERNERSMWVRLKAAQLERDLPLTHAGVLGQVWRGGPRQARLSQALGGIVLLAEDGDEIVTADGDDLALLAAASGRHVELIPP